MNLPGTASQPLAGILMLVSGLASGTLFTLIRRHSPGKVWKEIVNFMLVVLTAMVYFTSVYLINSGEMRPYTMICFLLGFFAGIYMYSVIERRISLRHKNRTK